MAQPRAERPTQTHTARQTTLKKSSEFLYVTGARCVRSRPPHIFPHNSSSQIKLKTQRHYAASLNTHKQGSGSVSGCDAMLFCSQCGYRNCSLMSGGGFFLSWEFYAKFAMRRFAQEHDLWLFTTDVACFTLVCFGSDNARPATGHTQTTSMNWCTNVRKPLVLLPTLTMPSTLMQRTTCSLQGQIHAHRAAANRK